MSRLELFRLDQTIQTPYRHLKTSTRHPSDTYHKLNRYQTINHVGPFLLIKTRWGFLFLACSSSSCQVLIRPTKVGLGLQVCSGVWHQIKLIIASDRLWLRWDFDKSINCCQALPQPQLQLSWAEIALNSSKTPTHPDKYENGKVLWFYLT